MPIYRGHHGTLRVSQTRFSHNEDSDSSVDSTLENSIYIRNSCTTVTPKSQQVQSSNTNLPKSYDLRPRLPPRDYHEKFIQNKIPPKMRCIPNSESAAVSNQLTQSQKRDVIIDSCQRTGNRQSNYDFHKNPLVHNAYTTFRCMYSTQSTLPGYSERQKEIKKRYFLKNFQKCLSKHNDGNAVIESSVHPKFCFSQSNILTATTCIAHCVSSDFAMGKELASALGCSYPEPQQMRKITFDLLPLNSLVTDFDQQHQSFI